MKQLVNYISLDNLKLAVEDSKTKFTNKKFWGHLDPKTAYSTIYVASNYTTNENGWMYFDVSSIMNFLGQCVNHKMAPPDTNKALNYLKSRIKALMVKM